MSSFEEEEEPKDLYATSLFVYVLFFVIILVYGLGFGAYLFLLQNVSVQHTYFASLPGGTLTSERYHSTRWIFLMLSVVRLFVPICLSTLILYRRSTCCAFIWIIFVALLIVVDILVFIFLGIDFSHCNTQNQPNNLCNDYEYCAVDEIATNPNNQCLNSMGCMPAKQLNELRANKDFIWLYWVTFGFVCLNVFSFMMALGIWVSQPTGVKKRARMEEEEVFLEPAESKLIRSRYSKVSAALRKR